MKAFNEFQGNLAALAKALINSLRELQITALVSRHDMKLVQELFSRPIVMNVRSCKA